jgi:hypothetical protein
MFKQVYVIFILSANGEPVAQRFARGRKAIKRIVAEYPEQKAIIRKLYKRERAYVHYSQIEG